MIIIGSSLRRAAIFIYLKIVTIMNYTKGQVIAIVNNIVQYTTQEFEGIEMPFDDVKENLKEWNIDDDLIKEIDSSIHSSILPNGQRILPISISDIKSSIETW